MLCRARSVELYGGGNRISVNTKHTVHRGPNGREHRTQRSPGERPALRLPDELTNYWRGRAGELTLRRGRPWRGVRGRETRHVNRKRSVLLDTEICRRGNATESVGRVSGEVWLGSAVLATLRPRPSGSA
ncbi:hypothetical protein SKAU_G00383240 [Synaphobranchus kaupii]|uniref:Uncharacterized protein n=1 Tax=Synaphobranchus kaupii TaxID=118154 RepID=A0A9Q1EE09_SYNKA|nr:hypothetical protein SKAU_G00383240 [Synaphobranchus kaupii]